MLNTAATRPVFKCQSYYLTIVERQAMQQDVVANAEALKNGLAQSGRAGFNKSDIKPESQPALQDEVKLLQP